MTSCQCNASGSPIHGRLHVFSEHTHTHTHTRTHAHTTQLDSVATGTELDLEANFTSHPSDSMAKRSLHPWKCEWLPV